MWSAFVTGFAEQASVEIEKTNKEISDRVLAEMSALIEKKQEAEELSETKRDAVRKQAAALQALAGPNLTESQIIGIINSGEADTVIKKLRDNTVGPEKIKQLFIPADPDAQADLEQYLSEVGKLTGKAPVRTEMERGAFGLRTRAGEAARARGLAAAGMTEEDLYKTSMVRPEGVEGKLDLSVFKEEESLSKVEDKLIKTMINPEASKDEKKQAASTLGRIGAAKDLLKVDKEGGPGGVKESDVRSNFRILDAKIKNEFAGPGDLVRYTDPATGEVSLELSNDVKPEVRQQINEARTAAFNSYIQEHYAQTGSVPPAVRRVAAAFLGTAPAAPKPAGAPTPKPPAGKVVVTTPDNRRIIFNTQEEADAFKAAAGIK